jgi:hypothetical protein
MPNYPAIIDLQTNIRTQIAPANPKYAKIGTRESSKLLKIMILSAMQHGKIALTSV